MTRIQIALRRLKAETRDLLRYVDLRAIGSDVPRVTDFNRCARPVLLLPGFMATRRGLTVLERRLRRDGYCVFSLNLGGLLGTFNTRSIEESALLVREKVERLYRTYELGPLTIIGHSKGGLIGRYYVKRLGGHERACALVTLGTPHHGTPAAYVGAAVTGLFAPSVWQLMPMSHFIRRLKEGAFPAHVRFASIYSKSDKVVPFPVGMIEQKGQPNLVNVEVEGITHHDFLTRRTVYTALRRELELAYGARAGSAVPGEGELRLVNGEG
jgi:triacylglycerol esterase/lipase EstA (alpha/beta hydrolase family)